MVLVDELGFRTQGSGLGVKLLGFLGKRCAETLVETGRGQR